MSWYSTGTATFTNSSNTVAGEGTNWMPPNAQVGDAIHAPDGAVYEITAVVSAGEITIAPAYQATTVVGAAYRIQPTRGVLANLLVQIATLLANFQAGVDGILAGRFPDGNAATPALRFLGDEGTGLFRKGANQLGIAVGGQEAGYIDSDKRLKGEMVTQSATDATADRLIKVGDFGLGGNPSASHLTNYSDAGAVSQFLADPITADPLDKPVTGRGHAGFHIAANETRWMQMFAQVAGSNSGKEQLFFRRNYNGAISDWRELFHQGSVLGTVSESGGVPTGAVIERGSNANGEYVRIVDGTQICTNGNAAITASPAAFTGTITKIDGDKLWIGTWN